MKRLPVFFTILFVLLLLCTQTVFAFTITSTLSGDIRPSNPDNLIVDVTITVDEASPSIAKWVVDINSPDHPDIKLDEFYFNLDGNYNDFSFYGFDPINWAIGSASVQGAGGASFMFEALDPAGPPDADDVTNDVSLSFIMQYNNNGTITPELFYNAAISVSNDAGSGQLGAHLQSLNVTDPATEDSGFAFGNYNSVPEPTTMLLLGAGLLGLVTIGRKTIIR